MNGEVRSCSTDRNVCTPRLILNDRQIQGVRICIYTNYLVHWDRITTEFERERLMVFESKLLTKLFWDLR